MNAWLVRLFVKDRERTQDPAVRARYGILAGIVGIVLNLILCAAKFLIGTLSASIAIQTDAVNNLSDAGASVVTLIGSYAAGRPADKEHPFGHARVEYIATMIVAFLILLVGFELGKESVGKILSPGELTFSWISVIVMLLSIGIKLWMGSFTSYVGRKIDSAAMKAATMDSVNDAITTGAILLSLLAYYFFKINLDGYVGVVVAIFILKGGIGLIKETISPLMGEAPDPEMVQEISERLLSYENIIGMHDLIVHDYGPGRIIATVHAEVPASGDVLELHEVIDRAEEEIGKAMSLLLTIHMDPISLDDEVCDAARKAAAEAICRTGEQISFHDLRLVHGQQQTNVIFDLVVPSGMPSQRAQELVQAISAEMRVTDSTWNCVIKVEGDYTGMYDSGKKKQKEAPGKKQKKANGD